MNGLLLSASQTWLDAISLLAAASWEWMAMDNFDISITSFDRG
jgi:hypothetical protein